MKHKVGSLKQSWWSLRMSSKLARFPVFWHFESAVNHLHPKSQWIIKNISHFMLTKCLVMVIARYRKVAGEGIQSAINHQSKQAVYFQDIRLDLHYRSVSHLDWQVCEFLKRCECWWHSCKYLHLNRTHFIHCHGAWTRHRVEYYVRNILGRYIILLCHKS